MSHTTFSANSLDRDHGVVGTKASNLLTLLRQAVSVRRQRRALMALDDRMLSDIGLSQSDAFREAHRSFFDLDARQPSRR